MTHEEAMAALRPIYAALFADEIDVPEAARRVAALMGASESGFAYSLDSEDYDEEQHERVLQVMQLSVVYHAAARGIIDPPF